MNESIDSQKLIEKLTAELMIANKQLLIQKVEKEKIADELTRKMITLKESEQNYITLANAGQALIFKSGTDKLCYWFNKVWHDFTGKTLDQENGNGWTDGIHPEDLERCINIFAEAFDQRQKFSMEFRLMHADGSYRWIQDDGSPSYDSEGVFIGYIGHCLDVNKRKSYESKLRAANKELLSQQAENADRVAELKVEKNRFTLAIEGSKDGLWDWNISTNEFIFSEQYEIMLGYDVGSLPKNVNTFYGLLHPDDSEPIKKVIQEYFDKKGEGFYENSFRLRAKDGSWKWILSRGKAEFDKEGQPLRFVGFHTDITEKKVLELELKKSYEILHKLAENIPGSIYQYRLHLDGSSSLPYVSKGMEDVYEVSLQDLAQDASLVFKSIHEDDLNMVVSLIEDSARTMKEWNIEYRVNLKKKGLRWLHGKSRPEKLEDGSTLWHGFVHDISEEKAREEALLLSNKRFEFSEKVGNVGTWEYMIEKDEFWASAQSKIIYGVQNKDSIFTLELVESCIPDKERVHQGLVDLIEKNADYNLEYEINPLDGSSTKTITSIGEVIRDESGVAVKVIGSIKDITEKARLLKELETEKNRFSLAIEGAQDGLWDWDLQTDELLLSKRFEQMLGYNEGDLPQIIDTWLNLLHPDDKEQAINSVQEYLDTKGEGVFENSYRLQMKNGLWKWFLSRAKVQFDDDGKPQRFVGFCTDITEQREHQDKLEYIAKHDSLTKLPNRFSLSEILTHSMHIAKRNNKQLALLYIDLDGFKEINDTYGHDAGDEVLSVVSSRMKKVVRASDIVSRIGGDEFVIVITNLNEANEVIPLIQKCLNDISKEIKYKDSVISVSASIGISFYPQANDIGDAVFIRQADQAMYEAKTLGKNQYSIFNVEASEEITKN